MKTRGYTLTEVAIVLGAIGIVLGGLWGIARSATNAARQERLAESITSISYNMRGLYSGRGMVETTNAEALMPLVVARGIIPSDILKGSGATAVALSSFGELTNQTKPTSIYKSLYVCGWSVATPVSTKCDFGDSPVANVPLFAIEAILASGGPCETAIVRNSNSAMLPGLTAVYSNGTILTPLPVLPKQAVAACNASINHVDFVFRAAP